MKNPQAYIFNLLLLLLPLLLKLGTILEDGGCLVTSSHENKHVGGIANAIVTDI